MAGAVSAAIALWFPMDPPGVPMSVAQAGHNILVAVAALAFAAALLASTRGASATYRRLTWLALAAMLLGGAGAALAHAQGWAWIGGFERITQAGYHGWLLMTGGLGLSGDWRRGGDGLATRSAHQDP